MTECLLAVRNLTVDYLSQGNCTHRAIDDVSFDLAPGQTLGLLGESGCGKTTLALAILGLIAPGARISGGSVCFRSEEILKAGEHRLQCIRGAEASIIFQDPALSLNPVMRVGDQVAEVVRAHTRTRRRDCRSAAEAALAEVHLAGSRFYSAYPHQLSAGQQQRVAIAQALVCAPSLLIADEPTSALDNPIQAEIIDLIKDLRRRLGLAVLFITHNPGLLLGFADRVVVMHAGRVVEEGACDQVLINPKHPYARGLLGSIPPPPRENPVTRRERLGYA
jgi:ABC-type dipeptide/oligopeptide/nickel transport system ATPase component